MKKVILLLLLLVGALASVNAQALVYRPQNPAFGGGYFNYSWLLSSAQAQDKLKDPTSSTDRSGFGSSSSSFDSFNSLNSLSETLSRQLLSRITNQLLNSQFGEETLQEGTFQFGDLRIDVTNVADGVSIRIVDGKGGETTITVPYF